MIHPGTDVKLNTQLFFGNANVRFGPKMKVLVNQYVPKDAIGVVEEVNEAEALVEFYWNPTGTPGMGDTAHLRVKRVLWSFLEVVD